ncbi:hypothetical protein GJAV_G00030230 [Gymnothorax javanicus]|nr:hypothetical protein GJAV_G00030230 [Gymnothorax javanicus]
MLHEPNTETQASCPSREPSCPCTETPKAKPVSSVSLSARCAWDLHLPLKDSRPADSGWWALTACSTPYATMQGLPASF